MCAFNLIRNIGGEVYLLRSNKAVLIKSFSPNRIVVDFTVDEPDTLIVNQNYYTGWRVKKAFQEVPAESVNGLIATRIEPGHYEVEFYFMPASFLIGMSVTMGFILFALVVYSRKYKVH